MLLIEATELFLRRLIPLLQDFPIWDSRSQSGNGGDEARIDASNQPLQTARIRGTINCMGTSRDVAHLQGNTYAIFNLSDYMAM